jgi:hypothetical protein
MRSFCTERSSRSQKGACREKCAPVRILYFGSFSQLANAFDKLKFAKSSTSFVLASGTGTASYNKSTDRVKPYSSPAYTIKSKDYLRRAAHKRR